jgi:hypothetical protein
MQDLMTESLETPRESEQVFLPAFSALSGTGTQMTWVEELVGYTVNGCFKIRDKSGLIRIVKRYKLKDQPGMRAWITLN